jgi:hypothetical protein
MFGRRHRNTNANAHRKGAVGDVISSHRRAYRQPLPDCPSPLHRVTINSIEILTWILGRVKSKDNMIARVDALGHVSLGFSSYRKSGELPLVRSVIVRRT